ncbi:MAG: hypothetical protein AB2448_01605 [Moorella sp. (in: firmicutes)]
MPMLKVKTKVIMDSGKEYLFNEYPEDFLKRFYDEETGKIRPGFIHGPGFSISVEHISSIKDIEEMDSNGREIKKLKVLWENEIDPGTDK